MEMNELLEIAKKGNLTDCGQRKCAEIIEAQQHEIDRLKGAIQEWIDGVCISQKHLSQIGKLEQQIDALTADKDEQTEQMKYLLRRTLPILEATNNQQELIKAIDALLGGAEDGK